MSDPVTKGLPPIAGAKIETLVLGSLPSRQSVAEQRYYAHPRNAFWPIMGRLVGAEPDLEYSERCSKLLAAGIGVWDVLRASVRPGSLDANIDETTAEPNEFGEFFTRYPGISRVFFNGRAAERLFERKVLGCAPELRGERVFEVLPSTSPAHAALGFEAKLARWTAVIMAPGRLR